MNYTQLFPYEFITTSQVALIEIQDHHCNKFVTVVTLLQMVHSTLHLDTPTEWYVADKTKPRQVMYIQQQIQRDRTYLSLDKKNNQR